MENAKQSASGQPPSPKSGLVTKTISFASTVASSAPPSNCNSSNNTGNSATPRTIVFGAYDSSQSPSSSHGNSQSDSPARRVNQQPLQKSTPLVFIPRTQSAPPKDMEIVAASQPSATKNKFHVDAPPYNPNAAIFMPTAPVNPLMFYPHGNYTPRQIPPAFGFQSRPQSESSGSVEVAPIAPPVASPAIPPVSALPSRTPSKAIKIVNPNTHEEVKLEKISKVAKPAPAPVSPKKEEFAVHIEPSPKKIITIVDPNSHKPVIVPNLTVTTDKVDEEMPKKEGESFSNINASIAGVEEALKMMKFEDDEDIEYSGDEEGEEEEGESDNGLLRHGQVILYPSKCVAYETPAAGGVWKYSRTFLIQFMPVCTQKPDKASFFSRVARKENSGSRGSRHNRVRKVMTEAERQAVMLSLNRADNAWAPVADEQMLAEEDRILREAKGILNKLTMEKFDVLSDKILALGIMSQNVLGGMIDLLFDKSTDEPRFASMYALLCLKIARRELEDLRKEDEAIKVESKFRRLLLGKCQHEYHNKRDWSAQHATSSPKSTTSGELTDEDYILIKAKRRVLGNMRFIGELFMQGLLTDRIMHSIVHELSKELETPEDDEIECLCKLLATVGKRLDNGPGMTIMNNYMARLRHFSKHSKLSSRIRFACLDVTDLRGRAWLGKEEGLKTLSEVQASLSSPQVSFASISGSERGSTSERSSDRFSSERSKPAIRKPSKSSKEEDVCKSSEDGWKTTKNTPAIKAIGKSFNLKDLRNQPTTCSPSIQTSSSNESLNRFQALDNDAENKSSSSEASPEDPTDHFHVKGNDISHDSTMAVNENLSLHDDASSNVNTDSIDADATAKGKSSEIILKSLSIYDEFVNLGNIKDLVELLAHDMPNECYPDFCVALAERLLESPRGHLNNFPLFLASTLPIIGNRPWKSAVKRVTGRIDDLIVDIPLAAQVMGIICKILSEMKIIDDLTDLSSKMSNLSKFKLTGHYAPALLSSFDYLSLSPGDMKQAASYAIKNRWQNAHPLLAESALKYRIESIRITSNSASFFFSSAKAFIIDDFCNVTCLEPGHALSIIIQQGFLALKKMACDNPNESLLVIASPYLSKIKDSACQIVIEAGQGVECESMATAFISYLQSLNLV